MDILINMYHLMLLMLIPAFIGAVALMADTYTQFRYYLWIKAEREKLNELPKELDFEQYDDLDKE